MKNKILFLKHKLLESRTEIGIEKNKRKKNIEKIKKLNEKYSRIVEKYKYYKLLEYTNQLGFDISFVLKSDQKTKKQFLENLEQHRSFIEKKINNLGTINDIKSIIIEIEKIYKLFKNNKIDTRLLKEIEEIHRVLKNMTYEEIKDFKFSEEEKMLISFLANVRKISFFIQKNI